ncbi:hypothetical protein BD779DRAFT_1671278 [Infundibulicybe gibba]|nr:hypothetical protein BD779DRAFT_1671278 [Infundibulicybe gibba]
MAHPTTGNTLGVAFIGFTISATLFGITVLQANRYYHEYSKDRLPLKLIVSVQTTGTVVFFNAIISQITLVMYGFTFFADI